MASILIRDIPDAIKASLKQQAALHKHSMEAEARRILQAALMPAPTAEQPMSVGRRIHARFAALGGVDLDLPKRTWSAHRIPDFSGKPARRKR